MRAAIRKHLTAVVDEEWVKHHTHEGVEAADAALAELQAVIWAIDAACQAQACTERPCTNGLAIASFVKALDHLRLAREQRLSLGYQGSLPLKWKLATSLAFVTSSRSPPSTARALARQR